MILNKNKWTWNIFSKLLNRCFLPKGSDVLNFLHISQSQHNLSPHLNTITSHPNSSMTFCAVPAVTKQSPLNEVLKSQWDSLSMAPYEKHRQTPQPDLDPTRIHLIEDQILHQLRNQRYIPQGPSSILWRFNNVAMTCVWKRRLDNWLKSVSSASGWKGRQSHKHKVALKRWTTADRPSGHCNLPGRSTSDPLIDIHIVSYITHSLATCQYPSFPLSTLPFVSGQYTYSLQRDCSFHLHRCPVN